MFYNNQNSLQNSLSKKWLLGVDVGGTTISTLLVDKLFQVHSSSTISTDVSSPNKTLQSIIKAINHTLTLAEANINQVAAIGLGIPGQVSPKTGLVDLAVNLNWNKFPAGQQLTNILGTPCFLENDVRIASLGISRFYLNSTIKNLAYVSIGTGIAAGIILNGKLYRGSNGMAGEIGHIPVDFNGTQCKCGMNGCLEVFAAGPAIAKHAQQAIKQGKETLLNTYNPVTAKTVYQAANAGDTVALEIANKVGYYLSGALYNLVMSYDVEKIILGGGVACAGDAFLQPILSQLARNRQQSFVAEAMLKPNLVELLTPGFQAGAWGGIALAEQHLNSNIHFKAIKNGHKSNGNGKSNGNHVAYQPNKWQSVINV